MAGIFSNPIVLAETAVGSLIDQRSVVLYEQQDFVSAKTELENSLLGLAVTQSPSGALTPSMLFPTVNDYVRKRALKELFTGSEIKYLSKINGFNMWGVSYMGANLKIDSELCKHPIETGQLITDTSIENPANAEVSIVMPTAFYTAIFEQIKDYYVNKKKLMLYTKFDIYPNMIITAMPYKLETGDVDRAAVNVQLEQIIEVEAEYKKIEGVPSNNIGQSQARVFDDTSRVNVGRIHTDMVSEVLARG